MQPRIILLSALLVAVVQAEPERFVITDLGAVGDNSTINTKAIQAAIDKCAKTGGGVLVVPKGTFLSGALYFKQGVNLLIEKDGVLKSTIARSDFPPIYTRWEGVERYWTAAFLNFIGMKNVEVSGEGLIDGSGDAWLNANPRVRRNRPADQSSPTKPSESENESAGPQEPQPKPADIYPEPLPTTATVCIAPDPAKLPSINVAGVALPRSGAALSPPRAVVFQNCTSVRVTGLTLKNQARWGFVFIYCENVRAENLTVRADHNIPSSDSMDIDSCRQVLVTGCDFECNDDCLSIKSGKAFERCNT
jgi:polygalacturonase